MRDPLPVRNSEGPSALPTSRSSINGDPTAPLPDPRRRIRSCALARRETRNEASLNWGSAPDPGIFQGIALAFDDSCQQCPGPRQDRGTNRASSTRLRSGYPLSGCVPALPDSVSPDRETMHYESYANNTQNNTEEKPDGEVLLSMMEKSS